MTFSKMTSQTSGVMSSSGVNIAYSGDVDSRSVGGGDSGLSSSDQVGGKPIVTSDDAGDTRPDVFVSPPIAVRCHRHRSTPLPLSCRPSLYDTNLRHSIEQKD